MQLRGPFTLQRQGMPNRQACLEASDVETPLAPKLYTT